MKNNNKTSARGNEMTTETQQQNTTTWSECQCEDCTGNATRDAWWTWPIPVADCAEKVFDDTSDSAIV
jgi:hypothetical protein